MIEGSVSRLVPVSVTVVAVPALAVAGAMLVSTGGILNVSELLLPPGVVTVMLCGPAGTVEAMTRVAVIEVGVTTGAPESVIPAGRFSVPPNSPVPARVTGTDEAADPCAGAIPVSWGVGAESVNASALLGPLGVVTITLTGPSAAVAEIAKLATIWVAVALVMDAAIPGPASSVAEPRSVPVRVTDTVLGADAPLRAAEGVMVPSTGDLGRTVKFKAKLVPTGVATAMPQAPTGPVPIAKVAVIWVGLSTVTTVAVIAGQAVRVDAGEKLVPVMVTVWVVIARPWPGENDTIVGLIDEICQDGP